MLGEEFTPGGIRGGFRDFMKWVAIIAGGAIAAFVLYRVATVLI